VINATKTLQKLIVDSSLEGRVAQTRKSPEGDQRCSGRGRALAPVDILGVSFPVPTEQLDTECK
jgi:hypothetical protein